jgi:multidrug resistance efflux pump
LDAARARLERLRELGRAGAVSAQSVDEPEARVVVLSAEAQAARARLELSQASPRPEEIVIAEARIRAARAGLEVARLQLRRTRLIAPRDGQILEVEAVPGELTGPNAEQPAVVLADTSGSQVRAFLEEQDAVRVGIGTEARIVADGLAGREFRGRVTRLRPRMEPKRFSSDDPAERFDIDTREIWIGFETPHPPLVGLRVRVILDPSPGVAAASESSGLASLGSNRWSAPGPHAGRP